MDEKHDVCLAKLSIIKSENCWQKFINTDSQRIIFFLCDYHKLWFCNNHTPFYVLNSKFVNDRDVAMKHLNE